MPEVWLPLNFSLSISKILNIRGCTLPFGGIILGRPSSTKTLAIELFRQSANTYYTDAFTTKSFVSHSTSVAKDRLGEIDLLPKIKNKTFLTPELAPTFSAKEEDLLNIIGIITRILDGHGYESDSGVHGHRGYSGEWMFVWVGAAVDIPRKVYKLLGNLGPKLYFLRLPKIDRSDDKLVELMTNSDKFRKRIEAIRDALSEYLASFDRCPIADGDGSLKKIPWNVTKDCPQAKLAIAKLAKLLAHLRGTVSTWHTEDGGGSDYAFSLPNIEDPSRASTQLYNLARGHALSQGRNYVNMEDLDIVTKVVLSTAPIERVTIFDFLLQNNGGLTTTELVDVHGISKPTALRTMAEFKVLELVDVEWTAEHESSPRIMKLKKEFEWFLGQEFTGIRRGFIPIDNSMFLEGRKEKTPLVSKGRERQV
jgi:hypothetical protein